MRVLDLLEAARGDVFPDYAMGFSLEKRRELFYAGCGTNSLFDLASLTKVICTTTLAAIAEQKAIWNIDQPVKDFFPNFPDARVTLSHLLNHSSGLPAWLDLHSKFHDPNGLGTYNPIGTPEIARREYENSILESYVAANFEKQTTYSDLGFMLLGWALEKTTQMNLDALFQLWIVQPTKLKSLQFLPTSPDVVPTEDCPWRGHILRGEVHDDNCYVLGGVAGHAGLFGNLHDVLSIGELWLNAFSLPHTTHSDTFLSPAIAQKYFTKKHIHSNPRVLGWDGVSADNSSTGHYFSLTSRGHLGYTGTSLWIDPVKKLVAVLLTNRVHPSRANEKIKAFRPIFHDTLMTDLGFAP